MVGAELAVHTCPEAFRNTCDQARRDGHRVGLVPTMGSLHEGHVALIAEAGRHATFVAVSIFVNPTQFGPGEDFAAYPRMLDRDRVTCTRAGASCLFAPSAAEMYPQGESTRVRVEKLSETLCGVSRPKHFEGVATVVAKLLILAGPCVAVFGRKDYQQLRVVERMVGDLLLPVEVIGHPTVREPDGLAMSSRNAYLSLEHRARAAHIPVALSEAVGAFESGQRDASTVRDLVRARIERVVDSIDYVELADPATLEPYGESAVIGDRVLLALAVRIGPARLIDNVVLGEDRAPCGEDANDRR